MRAAAVARPVTVPDVGALRSALHDRFQQRGRPPPRWLATTVEDPGAGVTAQAVAEPTGGLLDRARVAGRVLAGGTRVHLQSPQPHGLDGDPQGTVTSPTFAVEAAAPVVRVSR